MSELIIKISNRDSDNFGGPLNELISNVVFAIHSKKDLTKVVFDLSGAIFLSPLKLCGIVAYRDILISKGIEVSYLLPNPLSGYNSYLNTIHFPLGLSISADKIDEVDSLLDRFKDKTYTPIIHFPVGEDVVNTNIRDKILSIIRQIIKNQLNITGDLAQALPYFLSELSQNVQHHSQSDKGSVCAQFYRTKNYLDLCIVDTGRGLYKSYTDNNVTVENDKDAIKKALQGLSTKENSPQSRGFGISTSRNMLVNGIKGKFFIWSGNSFFYQDIENENLVELSNDFYFQGCYIALRVPYTAQQDFKFYDFVEGR